MLLWAALAAGCDLPAPGTWAGHALALPQGTSAEPATSARATCSSPCSCVGMRSGAGAVGPAVGTPDHDARLTRP